MKIWQRYFIFETLKVFFLITFCFYAFYVILDYAMHSGSSHYHSRFSWGELTIYYFSAFVQNLNVIAPFALLISTIRTLINLNVNNELVSLMCGGVKIKKLLYPFLFLGLMLTFILYLNTELMLPKSLSGLRRLHDHHQLQKRKKLTQKFVQSIALKDNSTLIFLNFDSENRTFSDSFWVKSFDEIYKIKKLSPLSKPPQGYFVDHLARDENGFLTKLESFEELEFLEMRFNKKALLDTFVTPEELPLRALWKKIPARDKDLSEKEATIITTFYQKLAMPWFGMLAVIAPIPFCVRIRRDLPIFLIYAFSLFGLAACFLIIDSATVLGERQILSPEVAVLSPFLLIMSYFLYKFFRV